uniref:Uncharacterized protein n=1 Tax=Anguilla anguilla TaxID=7936 RepID=A0A0E9RWG7_ANGAN
MTQAHRRDQSLPTSALNCRHERQIFIGLLSQPLVAV